MSNSFPDPPTYLSFLPTIDFDPYARQPLPDINIHLTPTQFPPPLRRSSAYPPIASTTPNRRPRVVPTRSRIIPSAFVRDRMGQVGSGLSSLATGRAMVGAGHVTGREDGSGLMRSGSGSGSGSEGGRRGPKGLDILLSPTKPDLRNGSLPLTPSSSRDDPKPMLVDSANSYAIGNILSSSVPASRPIPRTYQTTSAIPHPVPSQIPGKRQKVISYLPKANLAPDGHLAVAPGPKSPGPMMFDFRTTDRSPGLAPTTSPSLSSPPLGLSLLSQRLKDEGNTSALSTPGKDSTSSSTASSDPARTRAPKLRARAMSVTMKIKGEVGVSDEFDDDDDMEVAAKRATGLGTGSGGIKGKRKGMVFKCEDCSKVYRHPSCLSKHRWEHSVHWGTSSKLFLSKHQQVQLLEAATILVHLDPSKPANKTPLPEDKSLWPAAVSPPTKPTKMPHRPSFSQALGKPTVSPYTPASSLPDRSGVMRRNSPGAASSSSTESSERAASEEASVSGSGSSNGQATSKGDTAAKSTNALHFFRRPSEGSVGMPVNTGPARTPLPPRQSFGSPPVGYHPYTRMGSLPDLGLSGFHIGSASPRTYAASGTSTTPTGSVHAFHQTFPIGAGSYVAPGLGLPQSSLRGGIEEGDEDMSANEDEDDDAERAVRDMSVEANERDDWDQADEMEMDE